MWYIALVLKTAPEKNQSSTQSKGLPNDQGTIALKQRRIAGMNNGFDQHVEPTKKGITSSTGQLRSELVAMSGVNTNWCSKWNPEFWLIPCQPKSSRFDIWYYKDLEWKRIPLDTELDIYHRSHCLFSNMFGGMKSTFTASNPVSATSHPPLTKKIIRLQNPIFFPQNPHFRQQKTL